MNSRLRKSQTSGNVKDWLSMAWSNPISGKAIRYSLVLFSLLVLLVGLFYWQLPPEIPLAYSRPWGPAQLVPSAFLFFIIGFILGMQLVNILLAGYLINREEVLAQIIAWANVLILMVIDIAVFRVVILVA